MQSNRVPKTVWRETGPQRLTFSTIVRKLWWKTNKLIYLELYKQKSVSLSNRFSIKLELFIWIHPSIIYIHWVTSEQVAVPNGHWGGDGVHLWDVDTVHHWAIIWICKLPNLGITLTYATYYFQKVPFHVQQLHICEGNLWFTLNSPGMFFAKKLDLSFTKAHGLRKDYQAPHVYVCDGGSWKALFA